MLIGIPHRTTFALAAALAGAGCLSNAVARDQVNFSREVLPILSDRCFHCHGPDPSHRKALALAGSAAFEARDYATAARHWQQHAKTLQHALPQLLRALRQTMLEAQNTIASAACDSGRA